MLSNEKKTEWGNTGRSLETLTRAVPEGKSQIAVGGRWGNGKSMDDSLEKVRWFLEGSMELRDRFSL